MDKKKPVAKLYKLVKEHETEENFQCIQQRACVRVAVIVPAGTRNAPIFERVVDERANEIAKSWGNEN